MNNNSIRGITLFHSTTRNQPMNNVYDKRAIVHDVDGFRNAVAYDYVGAKYKDNKRSNGNFIESNALMLDCDNTHSEDSSDWITVEDVKKAFPDVCFYYHYSRNNNKVKHHGDKTFPARPKFHIVFPLKESIDSAEAYTELKAKTLASFTINGNPYFDSNARDAARFFFGTENPDCGAIEGPLCIDEFIANNDVTIANNNETTENQAAPVNYKKGKGMIVKISPPSHPVNFGVPIQEGTRSSTLSADALKLIKRYGDTDDAYDKYRQRASDCVTSMDESQLESIYEGAKKKFYSTIKTNPEYVPPEQYNEYGFKFLPETFTDVGQADVLAREYSNKLAYTDSLGWLVYNGIVWVASVGRDNPAATDITIELTKKQLAEANEAYKRNASLLDGVNEKTKDSALTEEQAAARRNIRAAKEYLKHVYAYQNSGKLLATLSTARGALYRDANDFDNVEQLLNTPSGTIDLRTGIKQDHDAKDAITQLTAVDAMTDEESVTTAGNAMTKQWTDAVDTFFTSDSSLIDYVQEVVGMACFGKVYVESLFIATGDGSNGKSTFWNTIARVLGTYSGKLSAELLTDDGRNHKPELASLKGKRLVIISETEEGMPLSGKMLKTLASTDPIQGEAKFKAPASFIPQHTAILYTNYLPELNGRDNGTRRRIGVIPFNARFSSNGGAGTATDVKNYSDTLFHECGPAILRWMIQGAVRAYNKGFNLEPPIAVTSSTNAYQEDYDWLQQFLLECTNIDSDFEEQRRVNSLYKAPLSGINESSKELYDEYKLWARDNEGRVRSNRDFKRELEREGFTYRHTMAGNVVYGLQLRGDLKQERAAKAKR